MALDDCQLDKEPDLFKTLKVMYLLPKLSSTTFVNIYFFPYKINYVNNDFREGYTILYLHSSLRCISYNDQLEI